MDLSSINKIIQTIISKKSIFLAVVVVLGFIVSAIVLYGDFSTKINSFETQNQSKIKKIDRIKEYDQSKEELKKFLASLPRPLNPDELIGQVEDYAINNRITIVNISSKDMEKHDDYKSMEITMSIKAPSFKNLLTYFRVLETSPYSLRIKSFSTQKGETPESLESNLIIIATELNT